MEHKAEPKATNQIKKILSKMDEDILRKYSMKYLTTILGITNPIPKCLEATSRESVLFETIHYLIFWTKHLLMFWVFTEIDF